MTTALLIAVFLMLAALLAMILTGWPGIERKEIEKTGQDLRRELAQHRADSLQFLHAMRMELEETVRETLEQNLDSFSAMNNQTTSRRRKYTSVQKTVEEPEGEGINGEQTGKYKPEAGFHEPERQLLLFSEQTQSEKTQPERTVSEREEFIVVPVFDQDDLPDVSECKLTSECDDDDIPDASVCKLSSAINDDIPDIEDL
ncbi:MAG: hypothetical protein HGA59_03250 [Chlorobiaceae bacterium]|nr:hypothetical protein [Chlorobiaceae bacterium]NTV16655.1 hypothetical protein [Chlorobiaceae bacterium]